MTTANRRIGVPEFDRTGYVYPDIARAQAAEIVAKYPQSRSALLPLLHLVQAEEGYITQDGVDFCAGVLGLTEAEVAAVATFYTMYKRRPCGEHLVSVCTNTLCATLGGDAIYSTLLHHLDVGNEETAGAPGTPGSITIESAECLAACDHAPVVTVNYEYYDNQTPDSALDLVTALQAGERPHPTRGAPLTDFRSVEREIAGIFTDLGDRVTATTQSPETLRGVLMAERNGETAPAMPENPPDFPPLPEKK